MLHVGVLYPSCPIVVTMGEVMANEDGVELRIHALAPT